MAYNVEAALISWLPSAVGMDGLGYAEVPDPRPERFLVIRRTGGTGQIGIDYPVIGVDCWAPTTYEASELALAVRDAMLLRAVELDGIRSVEMGTFMPSNDEDSGCPRYVTSFDLCTIA